MPESIQLPILGPGITGRSKAVTAQKRQNLFLEVKPERDKSNLVAYSTPGLRPFADTGANPSRGLWWFQAFNRLYSVSFDELLEIDSDGSFVSRGQISSTSGTVSMADNGIQLMIVDGDNGYIFQPTTSDLPYVRTSTTVVVTETLTTRITGQTVYIQGDDYIPSGDYVISVPELLASTLSVGVEYVITSLGTTDFTLIGASLNQVGIVFTATGPGTGTGTASNANEFRFDTVSSGSATGNVKVLNNLRNIRSAYTGTNFPKATTVTFLDSYFAVNVIDTKQFWLSGQYDGFYWDPLQFASKESYTDNLEAVTVDNGCLVLIGAASQEYWQNTGAYPFPLQRIAGSPIDTGIVALWSVARCAGEMFYLGKSRRGGISVFRTENYRTIAVSTPDLDYNFQNYQSPGDAIAYSYRYAGHEFYVISFQAEAKTWMYDATSDVWSDLTSGSDSRHYGQRAAQFQNEIYVSDYRNGMLYVYDPDTYTDNGDYIARELITPHFFVGDSFNKLHIYRVRLDMEQGTGDKTRIDEITHQPVIYSPQAMLQVSRDGGYTYGNEMWTSFGQVGEYLRRAEWRRLGVSRNYVFKFRITDPVKVVLIGAAAYATQAAK